MYKIIIGLHLVVHFKKCNFFIFGVGFPSSLAQVDFGGTMQYAFEAKYFLFITELQNNPSFLPPPPQFGYTKELIFYLTLQKPWYTFKKCVMKRETTHLGFSLRLPLEGLDCTFGKMDLLCPYIK